MGFTKVVLTFESVDGIVAPIVCIEDTVDYDLPNAMWRKDLNHVLADDRTIRDTPDCSGMAVRA